MLRCSRAVASTLAVALVLAPSTAAKPQPLRQLAAELVRQGAPGAIVAVRTPAGLQGSARGVGDRASSTPLRLVDRFRVASITKSFVATTTLLLVGEGKLGLDDPVERWLPGLVPNGGAITLRELLDHTSGLFNYTEDSQFDAAVTGDPGRSWAPRELLAYATAHPPLFAPGTSWSYSNTNYIVLGLVLEAATGEPLEQLLRERIFQPLGLASTSFPSVTAIDGRHVHGYIGSATVPLPPGTLLDLAGLSPTQLWAAGAIVSNAGDVTRFYARLLRGGVLAPDLLAAMRAPAPHGSYGLGLARTTTRCGLALGHDGDFPGYRTVVYARPSGGRVALVTVNIDPTRVSWNELHDVAARAFCSKT